MVKQLKNRYNDTATHRKFVIGIDRSKMKLFDVEENMQQLVAAHNPLAEDEDEDNTPARRGAYARPRAGGHARAHEADRKFTDWT
jgi:hypothetical protein